jgi:hypothetical protein
MEMAIIIHANRDSDTSYNEEEKEFFLNLIELYYIRSYGDNLFALKKVSMLRNLNIRNLKNIHENLQQNEQRYAIHVNYGNHVIQ